MSTVFRSSGAFALGIGLACTMGGVAAGQPEAACVTCGVWGDGSDGDHVIPPGSILFLTVDANYRDLTVSQGGAVETGGHTLRVCGTLTNLGTIQNGSGGGEGGEGGVGGLGADPQLNTTLDCGPRQTTCTPGLPGLPGEQGCVPQAGRGGDGGCGGGGGGGAYNTVGLQDADGGNGAKGGDGGNGGGYVRIFAFRFHNEGLIHADGSDGQAGQDGPTGYEDCGAEYYQWGVPTNDLAGGGGGGGGGGNGGNGGTVEIHYANLLLNSGVIRAQGGAGAAGGAGGEIASNTIFDRPMAGVRQDGCQNGCGDDVFGHGGRGAYLMSHTPEDGQPGPNGSSGLPGTVILDHLFNDCNNNEVADEVDIAEETSPDINCDGIPDECRCPGDVFPKGTGDGVVNVEDFLQLLADWGPCVDQCDCSSDTDCDGAVTVVDFLKVLADWGVCPLNPLCVDATGPCNMPNDTPGCDDPVCCTLVCNEGGLPVCCLVEWLQPCADAAIDIGCASPPSP
jgi:hypothetical protein